MKPREIKARINGLGETVSITRAMETIAAAKMLPSQAQHENAVCYRDGLTDCLAKANVDNIYVADSIGEKRALLVVSSERGLCGGYNAGIRNAVRKNDMTGVKKVCFLGRSVPMSSKEDIIKDDRFLGQTRRDLFGYCEKIAEVLAAEYESGEIDSVYALYYDFLGPSTPVCKRILPFNRVSGVDGADREISNDLLLSKRLFAANIYCVVSSAVAVENLFRMTAMKSATANGVKMLDELSIVFNQTRQNEITSELNDAVNASRSKEI